VTAEQRRAQPQNKKSGSQPVSHSKKKPTIFISFILLSLTVLIYF
jgi:hypothetical protein